MSVTLIKGSTQFIYVPLRVLIEDDPVLEPTDEDNPVQIAFKTSGDPILADFKNANWVQRNGQYMARILIGDSEDALFAPAIGRYRVAVRFLDSPEDVWLWADYLTVK